MNKKIFLYATLVFLFLCSRGFSQEVQNTRGWNLGLNFAGYYVSPYTANYYNGSEKNENKISYIFDNYYWYQEIKNYFNEHEPGSTVYDTMVLGDLPQKMKYNFAVSPGLFLQYNFNNLYSITLQFNYLKLRTKDAISINFNPKPYPTFEDIRLFSIQGLERRVYIDVSIRRNFIKHNNLKYFLSAGFNLNSTKVLKSFVYIGNREYSMINIYGNNPYVPNTGMQEFEIYQGGIGFGTNVQGGVSFIFNNIICVEPFVTAHYLKVHLEGYTSMRPGVGAGIRFIY